VQTIPITTKVVCPNPARGEVYSIQHAVGFSGFLHQ